MVDWRALGAPQKTHKILKIPLGTLPPPAEVGPRPRKGCINFFNKRFLSTRLSGLSWPVSHNVHVYVFNLD